MKVPGRNERTILEKTTEPSDSPPVPGLAARFNSLTRQLDLAEAARKKIKPGQELDDAIHQADDASQPIELVTDNGFSITRPWETGSSPPPSGGIYPFCVGDATGAEFRVAVEISRDLIVQTAFRTRGRIHRSSSFWITCAERHLAEYVWAEDAFPHGNSLLVENLKPEEVILALRWCRSETD